MLRTWSWAVLALLLAATLVGAVTLDRRTWPGLIGDEATYLMQAQSLAWDFDLRYSRADFDRFLAQWGTKPDGLILQSGDGGALVYSKPVSYSFYIAPFVRLAPVRGPAIANALLLLLAAVVAAHVLERRIGPAAPLWVAAWIFASVAFAYVFWVHSDLFLMCLAALALSLAYGSPGEESRGRRILRWLAVGVLLGIVATSRPFYASLLLPAALAVPVRRRTIGIAALLAGAALLAASSSLFNLAERESWTSYAGARRSFYSYTGFPEVDFPPEELQRQVAERGSHAWIPWIHLDARQTAWNSLYFLAGRHVGVLPYYLPLLLGLLAFRPGEGRWALLLAVVAALAAFFVMRPFNFWGGGGAIANRYFLPLYPAFWFLAARPAKAWWAFLAAALAAPFLWPLWAHPRTYPLDPAGGLRYVSDVARAGLPYETTQSHLKPSGKDDFIHNGLWIKPLTNSVQVESDGARLRLTPGRPGEILIGSPTPLSGVRLDAANGTAQWFLLHRPRAVHRMWWTEEPFYLYQIDLEAEGDGMTFTLTAQRPA
ncbi:MAG TPA: hypothetical protein VE685_20890 [Thermoanaerobaculia bacterium]|nr:hypothetical protein [Thermoanaerobaculia bacterium]